MSDTKYCDSLINYKRWETKEVNVGNVKIGGNNPIVLQSMNSVPPMDTDANVEQAIKIYNKGGEIVRITAPSSKEADNLKNVKKKIEDKALDIPLVADIHFNPKAAYAAADAVDKVRINPGNFAEIRGRGKTDYTDEEYAEALEYIKSKLKPLIDKLKERNAALRIGSNHGSLAQRILNKYGDTPEGMVEAAMEYLRICVEMDFDQIVLSMKASNIRVMVQAYRLLVHKMRKENMNFPIHLGVTESGEGEDGRVKSAAGIGAMLEDGIGDTIRVSLTEEPEEEIPVAEILADRYKNRAEYKLPHLSEFKNSPINPFEYKRRETYEIKGVGKENDPLIINYDFIFDGSQIKRRSKNSKPFPLIKFSELKQSDISDNEMLFVLINTSDFSQDLSILKNQEKIVLILDVKGEYSVTEHRWMIFKLIEGNIKAPVILKREYDLKDSEKQLLYAAIDFGAIFIDGLADGIWMQNPNFATEYLNNLALNILQASRSRITKTDYISCPSCGRTLFNIQEATAVIREKTDHLKGVKIGIMGCIVNGPGEMADADYGYVGAGKGKITLYKKKEVMKRSIPEENAVEELINLIKENGDWVERN